MYLMKPHIITHCSLHNVPCNEHCVIICDDLFEIIDINIKVCLSFYYLKVAF